MSKERLKAVMSIQTETYRTKLMDDYLREQFKTISSESEIIYDYSYKDGNTYITKGIADTYPCVIAHTDTVHDICEDLTVFDNTKIMFAMDMTLGTQTGIGGDDKVGIYIALEMLRSVDVIKVAFFRDEEHGCLGSAEADMNWFKDVEFVLQCDRQGYKDFVSDIYGQKLFDRSFSKAISKILTKYGKKENPQGGLTDVYQLLENGLDVCVANISCGYYRPHTDTEVIVISEVFDTRDMVLEIIDKIGGTMWKNGLYTGPYIKKKTAYESSRSFGEWNDTYEDRYNERYKEDKSKDRWDDFYDEDREYYNQLDLETCCSVCNSEEIIYDDAQDADWCYSCDDYTNHYSNDTPNGLSIDEYEEWLTKKEKVSLSKSKLNE